MNDLAKFQSDGPTAHEMTDIKSNDNKKLMKEILPWAPQQCCGKCWPPEVVQYFHVWWLIIIQTKMMNHSLV